MPLQPWLTELRDHPAHHSLLAAYGLLTHLSPPDDPPICFTHSPELGLPLGDLQAVDPDPLDPARHLVTTAIAGPLGHDTPLPLALADALDRPLARALLDRFHHRRTLLLCRGLLAADLAATLDGHDPWSRRIAGLTGLARLAARDPAAALRLAPIFAVPDRSPRALGLALRRLFPDLGPALRLRVEPLPTRLTPLAVDQRTRLGDVNARLGDTAALGDAVCLPGSAARLVLGPVPLTALAALAPDGPDHAVLRELLAAFIPEPIALELHLELEACALPAARLGQRRLGRDLWLRPSDRPTAATRVPLPTRPPCPRPATRSASSTAAAA